MVDRRLHILIVDDSNLVRLYYRQILETAGYDVDEALNGVEGLERALLAAPALMIVDVNMPQMDGLSYLTTLRRRELPLSATPVLVTSTESSAKDKRAARAAGANYYLVKPVGHEVLLEHVALLCGRP